MIFSELYSAYYNAVAAILSHILAGETDEKALQEQVVKKAFGESLLTILPSLKSEKWQLVTKELRTPITHTPTMPLTVLEKSWLKAISLDPRVRLFDLWLEGLEDVEPLFTADDYVIFDKYSDGDPFEDEGYIERFHTVLDAIKNRHPLTVVMTNRKGVSVRRHVMPIRLEYSEKDDKFRLISADGRFGSTINLGRVTECRKYNGRPLAFPVSEQSIPGTVTLSVTDERNALERVMLHFAHFEKRAERIDGRHYRLYIKYDRTDETELVIRILSFGPFVKVEEPPEFVELIKDRLRRQMRCHLD